MWMFFVFVYLGLKACFVAESDSQGWLVELGEWSPWGHMVGRDGVGGGWWASACEQLAVNPKVHASC